MATRTTLALLSVAVLVGVGTVIYTMRAPAPMLVSPSPAAGNAAPRMPAWFAGDAQAPQPLPLPRSALSLAQQIDQLTASGKPEDAFEAYVLVRDCIYFQRWKTLPFIGFPGPIREMTVDEMSAEATLCAGLTERMKLDRIDHLARAVKAGVAGADTAFLEAGPFGDPSALVSRPGDPLVVAWKEQALGYLTARANDADVGSLGTLQNLYRTDNSVVVRDPVLALAYTVALHDIHQQFDLPPGAMPYDDIELRWMQDGLTAPQIATATAAGSKIAEVWRARRQKTR
jgi:hypothetical protein